MPIEEEAKENNQNGLMIQGEILLWLLAR